MMHTSTVPLAEFSEPLPGVGFAPRISELYPPSLRYQFSQFCSNEKRFALMRWGLNSDLSNLMRVSEAYDPVEGVTTAILDKGTPS